jgi:hypothetical protein
MLRRRLGLHGTGLVLPARHGEHVDVDYSHPFWAALPDVTVVHQHIRTDQLRRQMTGRGYRFATASDSNLRRLAAGMSAGCPSRMPCAGCNHVQRHVLLCSGRWRIGAAQDLMAPARS